MDFLYKIRDTFLSLPFPLQVIIGIVFINIFPPVGIGIIFFAVFTRRKNRYMRKDRNNKHFDYTYDTNSYHRTGSLSDNTKTYDNNEYNYTRQSVKMKSDHIKDLKSAEKILSKVKNYIKKGNLKQDMKGIYLKMQSEYDRAKKTVSKINEINDMLNDPDWNPDRIEKNIRKEENNINQDPKRIERMREMLNHIKQLMERKSRLINQISDLNISFQTIYTKLTLLNIQEENNFDEIETEIQRILDFQLKVDEYEDKLDREMKEFL